MSSSYYELLLEKLIHQVMDLSIRQKVEQVLLIMNFFFLLQMSSSHYELSPLSLFSERAISLSLLSKTEISQTAGSRPSVFFRRQPSPPATAFGFGEVRWSWLPQLGDGFIAITGARLKPVRKGFFVISLCAASGFILYGGRLFYMSRRFPVESRGRQKKLFEGYAVPVRTKMPHGEPCSIKIKVEKYYINFFIRKVLVSAFDEDADIDVLYHPLLNLIYYMVVGGDYPIGFGVVYTSEIASEESFGTVPFFFRGWAERANLTNRSFGSDFSRVILGQPILGLN
ncbi:Tobamovirus multiplication protein 1 [Hibiscus syriacus]|uniref:Tobamovirus multiplication protein 1 n=1 Tax=Hibiscus syriacus TaxID=106335 RepID=A0A6A2YF22_HIBSY|nr:Tobamovirus multiplication protein 1 [Hibiscus syriacus]